MNCTKSECQTTAGCAYRGPRGEYCWTAGRLENFSWGVDYGKDLLTDINQLAHTSGTNALMRDILQRAYKEIVRLRRTSGEG